MSETTDEAAKHYDIGGIQTWDFVIAKKLGFLEGNVIKYITRWREKDGVKDLKKARDYINKLIHEEAKKNVDETKSSYNDHANGSCGVHVDIATPFRPLDPNNDYINGSS